MDNPGKMIRKLILLALLVFFIGGLTGIFKNRGANFDYVNYASFFLVALAATQSGLVFGLLAALVMVFAQISFLVIDSVIFSTSIYFTPANLWWLVLLTVAAFAFGFVGDRLSTVEKMFRLHGEEISDLLTSGKLSLFSSSQRFQQDLDYEAARAKRAKSVFLLVLLQLQDLDGIQLRFGKEGQGRVMAQLANGLLRVTRDTDKKGRPDDKTFALILPETPRQNLPIAVKRIMAEIKEVTVEYKGARIKYPPIIKISASAFPDDGDNAATLMQKAHELAENEIQNDLQRK